MSEKRRWIPFSLWPANWGLEGKRRQEQMLRYYNHEGEDLDEKLLHLQYDTESSRETREYKRARLSFDLKYNNIDKNTYDRELATINDEPYFRVISGDYSSSRNGDGQMTFELDWNTKFVEQLAADGWEGITEDQIINNWFEDSCRQMLEDEEEENPDDGHDFVRQSGTRIKRQNLGGDYIRVS